MQELVKIKGTGKEQRVTKKDIFDFLENRTTPVTPTPRADSRPGLIFAKISGNLEMDRMRKMISQRMLDSKRISAHVTSFIETDMTNIVQWREKYKKEFRKQTGDSITFTPILIEAVVKALAAYPMINISVDGERIVSRRKLI